MNKHSPIAIKVGKKIAEIRKKRDVTQEELAAMAKLNRAYVGYIERGERNPSIQTIEKIADVLKVEIHELFYFTK